MKKALTSLQRKLLRLAETKDLNTLSLRQIGSILGDEHPYAVHLAKKALIRDGRLIENKLTKKVILPADAVAKSRLISIPVFGRVSCGVATELANEGPRDFLSVSPSLINTKRFDDIFALIAAGDSMDDAYINGKAVDDGDYVIVHKSEWGSAKDGDYIISRMDDAYNLKKLRIDKENFRLVLLSESKSSDSYPPIFLAEEDLHYYSIDGTAVDVVKNIR